MDRQGRKPKPGEDLFEGAPDNIRNLFKHSNRMNRDKERRAFMDRKRSREAAQHAEDDAQFK